MLEATIFSYFAMNNLQDDIAAQQANIVSYRLPSFGKFSTSLTTSYWFGMPRNVSASGLAMDVDRVVNNQVDKDNNVENRINFNRMVGNRLSAMEHLIPEQMFSSEGNKAEGISAVKAIAIASAEGQKIWTITQENIEDALASINLDADTESEIRNSVNSGMIVTTHEQSINFNGWIGEGYIILDPTTGAGAYKISGGGNGGQMNFGTGLGYVAGMLTIVGLSGGLGPLGLPVLIGLIVTIHILLIATIVSVLIDNNYSAGQAALDFLCGFVISISIASAVNHFAKVITGLLSSAINTIGALMTIGGFSLGICS